jgi:hypothetical protein
LRNGGAISTARGAGHPCRAERQRLSLKQSEGFRSDALKRLPGCTADRLAFDQESVADLSHFSKKQLMSINSASFFSFKSPHFDRLRSISRLGCSDVPDDQRQ